MIGEMLRVRQAIAERKHPPRMMYAKTVAGIANAFLVMDRMLPAELAVAHFRPGASLPVILRFSNASAIPQPDTAPDMRGLALRLALPGGARHDMIFANYPTCLARDAEQFFEFAMIPPGGDEDLLVRLADRLGEAESLRIAAYCKASFRLCASLAEETFWSGCAYLWGDSPARFELRSLALRPAARVPPGGADALRAELAARLLAGDVRYRLAIQKYVDEKNTPIEDAATDWDRQTAPPAEIATLVIPRQDIAGRGGAMTLRRLDALGFNPWNAPDPFRPLGSLNRLRRLAYDTGAAARR